MSITVLELGLSVIVIVMAISFLSAANSVSGLSIAGSNSTENYEQQLKAAVKTHEYTLIAEDTTIEIAPGIRVEAWTYNGTVPGPTLTATEGDRVIIHFINKGRLPHTVHLHGDHPSEQDGVFEQIAPNGTYTYDVIATPAGAFMYHCHVSPVMQHVRMGLYGAFIVYPKTPLPAAREYVIVSGEYDTQNQLSPNPEYHMYNGFTEQYINHPLPAKTNETVRIYLMNMGLSPAYGMHIHGTLFKAYPSGIWQNPPMTVQSWELASGNAAILEAKWPWAGKFTFHSHGIPEEYGAMGYFNVTDALPDAQDGKDIAITKSINMMDWQANLTRAIQKADSNGNVTNISANPHMGDHGRMEGRLGDREDLDQMQESANISNANQILIVNDAAALGDKSYSPNPITVKLGTTVTWLDKDRDMHTVTSGLPNSEDAGELFDSGLTALIMPAKTYSHKFIHTGEFPYFCRIHPTMTGMVNVVP